MNNTERIAEIRERCATATPGPWRQSFFVDKYPRMPESEKQECYRMERLTIRGPGQIGTPQCNVVCRFLAIQDNDIEFIAHSREDTPWLLSEVERLTVDVVEIKRQNQHNINCYMSLHDEKKTLTAELEKKTRELEHFREEVTHLAIESVEREKRLAKLEAEVQYWADAEQDGRLAVLPCKVGGIVYWISPLHTGINYGKVIAIKISSFGFDLEILRDGCVVKREFEKVYLTRAHAAAALSAEGVE